MQTIQQDKFSESYKDSIFIIWYRMGKIVPSLLIPHIPAEKGRYPSEDQLKSWISSWRNRASALDDEVRNKQDLLLIQEKLEMLRRHAEVAVKMQNSAIGVIDENIDEEGWMTAGVALRMLTEGIKIERDSKGIPELLEKIAKKSDESLVEEIESLAEENRRYAYEQSISEDSI